MVTERRKKWERGIDQGMRNFAKQQERALAFSIIPVSCMGDMMKAAEAGDENARSALIAFANWSECVGKGMDNGVFPSCVICSKELTPVSDTSDGIGGWGQILPVKGAGTGIVAPICTQCIRRDLQELHTKLLDALEEDVGVKAMMMQ